MQPLSTSESVTQNQHHFPPAWMAGDARPGCKLGETNLGWSPQRRKGRPEAKEQTRMGAYRVVLADDHVLVRQGIKRILAELGDVQVVGEVGNGLDLLEMIDKSPPDLIILDISMPQVQGIEAAGRIKASHPGVKILVLTMHKNREYLYHALATGAEGYLLKEDADTELLSAIATLRQGGNYISKLLAD